MHITIINDCRDDNAAGRQLTRVATLSGATVSMVGVGSYADLEASGNLIDALDAFEGKRGAVLVNVAPRHKGEGENGTPFGYFWYKDTLVVSTVRGLTLSLVRRLALVKEFIELDVKAASEVMAEAGFTSHHEAKRISQSQFRSFDFVPRAAAFLLAGNTLPGETRSIGTVADAPQAVWWVDNFGNCKTTLLPQDIAFEDGSEIETAFGRFRSYAQLRSVPNGEAALIVGSSGLGETRFLEIVIQGGNAGAQLGLYPGAAILDSVSTSA